MAVALRDPAVLIVDAEFGILISADSTAAIDGLLLGFVVAARALCSTELDVPTSPRIRNNVVRFWTSAHIDHLQHSMGTSRIRM